MAKTPTFDINNLIVNHVEKLVLTRSDGSTRLILRQVKSPQMTIEADQVTKTDALGATLASFNRGKKLTFSGQSAIFDFNLLAAQQGVEKQVATTSKRITAPAMETLSIEAGTAHTLAHKPISAPTFAYTVRNDGTRGDEFKLGTKAEGSTFVYDKTANTVTFGAEVSGDVFITYKYEASRATMVEITGEDYGTTGVCYIEVLANDICDTAIQYPVIIELPSAQLDTKVDITFDTESEHPFSITASQAYCDRHRVLARIIALDDEEDVA